MPTLLKKAEKLFNASVRYRDKDLPCISCGKYNKLQAGHYVPVKNSSALRFDYDNVHGECEYCNGFDEFHLVGYRKNLINKIGLDKVLELENRCREKKKWTREELEFVIQTATQRMGTIES